MKLAIFSSTIGSTMGGVVTFLRNFTKRVGSQYDTTVYFYSTTEQHKVYDVLFELSDYADVKMIGSNEVIEADVVIFNTAWGIKEPTIKAKKVIQVIHADYRALRFRYKPHKSTDIHVAVGKHVANVFNELYPFIGIDYICRNLVDISRPIHRKTESDILRLVTASNVSPVKNYPRMIEFAKLIKQPFVWDAYGNYETQYGKKMKRLAEGYINFKGYVRDVSKPLAEADFLVQLSDTEGMSYSMLEALQQRTAIISTPFPSAMEIIEDGVNGYFCDWDLKNFANLHEPIRKLKLKPYDDGEIVERWKMIIES